MGKTKNVLTVVLIAVIFVCVVVVPFTVAIVNDFLAVRTLKTIKNIELPENSKILSEYAVAGKVSGNGNGMQYFGAILLESELSEEELRAYYREASDLYIMVQRQESDVIELNKEHYFDGVEDCDFENCYIVFSYGDEDVNWFLDLDLRGH